jgi:RecA-family ATPase
LRRICRCLALPFDEVCEWLQIVDASDLDPAPFTERRLEGVRHGVTTPTYAALAEYIKREGFEVLIVDNASNTFDCDEINRAMVCGFVRSLRKLVPATGAVLHLAHVDKLTSRAGNRAGTEAYSGSTAWHNSVRSRQTCQPPRQRAECPCPSNDALNRSRRGPISRLRPPRY